MKNLFLMMLAALSFVACEKDNFGSGIVETEEFGTLSLNNSGIAISTETETRSGSAYTYYVRVYNANGTEIDIDKNSDNTYLSFASTTTNIPEISLPANDESNPSYTLHIQTAERIPETPDFNIPVYGAERTFTITAGQTTTIDPIVCTLWKQCIVSISYNELFLEHLAGAGTASVTVNQGTLNYPITGNNTPTPTSQESRQGYFQVPKDNGSIEDTSDESIMTVVFEGMMTVKNDDNSTSTKKQTMTFAIDKVKARQWHKVKINMKKEDKGNASFNITINDMVVDETIGEEVSGSDFESEGIGEDPNKPAGNGGIRLDWTAGGDETVMEAWNKDEDVDANGCIDKDPIVIDNLTSLKFTATIPNNVAKFTVDISGTEDFEYAVGLVAPGCKIDLVNDIELVQGLKTFGIDFPCGDAITSVPDNEDDPKTIEFDLTSAVGTLLEIPYTGTQSFTMHIIDNEGCSNTIKLNLKIETTQPIK